MHEAGRLLWALGFLPSFDELSGRGGGDGEAGQGVRQLQLMKWA